MTKEEIKVLVDACTYKPGWHIQFHYHDAGAKFDEETGSFGRPYIQLLIDVTSDASIDSAKRDGSRAPWKSGKRYLSKHMCRQEVVGAVFGLIKDAEMHEAHEWFRYRGASIFNPHLDPDALAAVARKASSFNVRVNAMSMEEAP